LGLGSRSLPSAVDHLLLGHKVIALDGGGGGRRLGTVVAVLQAGSALRVLQHLEANGFAEITGSDGKGGLEKSQQLLIRRVEHSLAFASGQRLVAQSFNSEILIVDHMTLQHLMRLI
jgi:hypothetical protein